MKKSKQTELVHTVAKPVKTGFYVGVGVALAGLAVSLVTIALNMLLVALLG